MVANRGSSPAPFSQSALPNYSAMALQKNRMYASVADRAAGVRVVGQLNRGIGAGRHAKKASLRGGGIR